MQKYIIPLAILSVFGFWLVSARPTRAYLTPLPPSCLDKGMGVLTLKPQVGPVDVDIAITEEFKWNTSESDCVDGVDPDKGLEFHLFAQLPGQGETEIETGTLSAVDAVKKDVYVTHTSYHIPLALKDSQQVNFRLRIINRYAGSLMQIFDGDAEQPYTVSSTQKGGEGQKWAYINNQCTNQVPTGYSGSTYPSEGDCQAQHQPGQGSYYCVSSKCTTDQPADLSQNRGQYGVYSGSEAQSLCSASCEHKFGSGQPSTTNFNFEIPNPLNTSTLEGLINGIMSWLVKIAIPIAVIMIIWAGILMLTAGYNQNNWAQGKKILQYTLIGLAIIFIGKGFISLIKSILELRG